MHYVRFLPLLLLLAIACRPKPVWQRAAEQFCDCLREFHVRPKSAPDTLEYAKIVCKGRIFEHYHDVKVFCVDAIYLPPERTHDWQELEHARIFMQQFNSHVKQAGYDGLY